MDQRLLDIFNGFANALKHSSNKNVIDNQSLKKKGLAFLNIWLKYFLPLLFYRIWFFIFAD